MAAPGNSPIAIAFEGISGTVSIPTPVLLAGHVTHFREG